MNIKLLCLGAAALLLVTACGQSGSLYLPEKEPEAIEATSETDESAPAVDETEPKQQPDAAPATDS